MLRYKLPSSILAFALTAIIVFLAQVSSAGAQGSTGYVDADAQLITISGQYPDALKMCSTGQVYVFTSKPTGMQTGKFYHITNLYMMGSAPPGSPAVGAVSYCSGGCTGQWRVGSFREISGCPGSQPQQPQSPPQQPAAPPQVSFSVDQTSLVRGQCTTLRWDVDNVRAVYVDGQGVGGHDTRQVCPTSTTRYSLRAVTSTGAEDRSVWVNVQSPPPTAVPPTLTPVPPPQVVFSADRTDIPLGECANLSWALAWVQSWSLDNAPVSNPGGQQVCPKTTTTYNLAARAASGNVSRSVTINVSIPVLRVADFTLLDPTKHASLTDFTVMDNPRLLTTGNLWVQIANDGGAVTNAAYEIQVVLKGKDGAQVALYTFASGRPLSLTPISLGTSVNIQNVYVPINFTNTLDSGTIEVFLMPDPALGLKNSVLSKSIIPSQASTTAKKIRLGVSGSTFTDLAVVGPNQYGVETVWTDPDKYQKRLSTTEGYWWQDTVVLSFYVTDLGWRGCIMDYLTDSDQFDTVDIVYTEGKGCSGGGAGSAGVLIPEQALADYRSSNFATYPFKCLKSVAKQVTGQGNVIMLGWDCAVPPVLKMADIIGTYYGKKVSAESAGNGLGGGGGTSWGLPDSQPQPPVSTQSAEVVPSAVPTAPPATATPPPPPGVYVTNIRMEPSNPNSVEDARFFVTFLNTAGPLQFKWCVYIYNAGAQNPRGQTACDSFVDFPLGTYEYGTANTWKLGPGTPCADLTARVQGVETNGNRLIFKTPDFNENSMSFRVCP